ncbi:hypothetical protein C5167_022408 [Papaver somniferum]|uniref:Uncharacterized protein n=1 Tax=Papaver somniferum TaxID=3469 RepID=A0A4Y7JHW8_PAPSO|nr:hypothetical protein C5167_022408 [Papaver somniferum]
MRIKFIPLTVPAVEGLPPGSEATSNVPLAFHHLLMTAMDLTRPQVASALRELKPDYVFYDFTHWLPEVTKELGKLAFTPPLRVEKWKKHRDMEEALPEGYKERIEGSGIV